MKKLLTTLQLVVLACGFLLAMPVLAAVDSPQDNMKGETQQAETPDVLIVANLGMCIGDCASEQGICMGHCQGDGQCISNCAAAHGRCVARCHSR